MPQWRLSRLRNPLHSVLRTEVHLHNITTISRSVQVIYVPISVKMEEDVLITINDNFNPDCVHLMLVNMKNISLYQSIFNVFKK